MPAPTPYPKQQIRLCTSSDGVRIAYATCGTGPPIVKAANWLSHLEFDLKSPTLVLHASGDARVPFEESRLLASLIPGARFVPLESENHLLLESEPAWLHFRDELRAFLPTTEPADPAFATLTPRERDIVGLIAGGRDNAQIAARLGLSEKTVRNHITSIFSKLEVENRSQAIVLARKAGFDAPTG
jgi:DNA-binding CsgD family transcriptional regulator